MPRSVTLWPGQRKAIDLLMAEPRVDVGMAAGVRGGKTRVSAVIATLLAYRNPATVPGLIVAPTYPMARDVVRPELEKFWREQEIDFEWRASDFVYHLSYSDTPILLRSGDDPNKIRGLTVGWGGMDEADLHSSETYQVLLERVSHPDATCKRIWASSTPIGFGLLYKYFGDPARPRADRTALVQWSTDENLAVLEAAPNLMRDMEETFSRELYLQQAHGQFTLVGQQRTYYAFNRAVHLRAFGIDTALPLDLCVDFNVAPAVWVISQGKGVPTMPDRAIDEISVSGEASTVLAVREFKRRYPQYANGANVRIFGDASGHARKTTGVSDFEVIRQQLPRAQFYVRQKNPNVKDRVNAVNSLLRNAQGQVRSYVHPTKCPRLLRDLEQVRNIEGTWEIDKKADKELTHASDAYGYKIAWCYPVIAKPTASPNPYRAASVR